MQDQEYKNQKNIQVKIDAIAERWVSLVLSHVRAKRLSKKEPIKINNKYEYATK